MLNSDWNFHETHPFLRTKRVLFSFFFLHSYRRNLGKKTGKRRKRRRRDGETKEILLSLKMLGQADQVVE